MHDYPETTTDDRFLPSWFTNKALIWPTLGLIAWLGFELTAQPAVVAAVVCSKVGWNDFLTAFWLRRRDPHRGRGRACAWFCLSSGVTKMVVSAFAMTVLISIVLAFTRVGQPRQNPNLPIPAVFWGPLVLMVAGAPVLSLLAFCGCVSARWHKVRVWIDNQLHHARRANSWPPDFSSTKSTNMARGPWLVMLACTVVASIMLAAMVGAFANSYILGISTLLCPLLWITMVSRGAFADSPYECWYPQIDAAKSQGYSTEAPGLSSENRTRKAEY